MSKNDITGQEITNKPANNNYLDGYDRVFNKRVKEEIYMCSDHISKACNCSKGKCLRGLRN